MKYQIQYGQQTQKAAAARPKIGGLSGWLLARLGSRSRQQPCLVVRERISLAPRQSLSLVEADGRRLLIVTAPEGTPAFYALDEFPRSDRVVRPAKVSARISW